MSARPPCGREGRRTDPRKRDPWAPLFAETLAPLVANATSLEEAAALVAWKVWDAFPGPRIVFKANQTPLIMSPFQVLKARYGEWAQVVLKRGRGD